MAHRLAAEEETAHKDILPTAGRFGHRQGAGDKTLSLKDQDRPGPHALLLQTAWVRVG
jgi:hypothetical protein